VPEESTFGKFVEGPGTLRFRDRFGYLRTSDGAMRPSSACPLRHEPSFRGLKLCE
jgi:hypothetical protein